MLLTGRQTALLLLALSACKTPGNSTSAVKDDVAPAAGGDFATTPYPGPPIPGETESIDTLWNKYCVGTQNDAASIPGPNYATPEVKSASEMLTRFRDYSYSIYGQIAAHYKATPVAKPEGVSDNAHTFLTYLCGEFRDRPTMVEAKIRWINHTNFLKPEAQGQIDPTKDVWPQLTAAAYVPFIRFSDAFYSAKQGAMQGSYDFGKRTGVDKPVPAMSVCETKFIFSEYVDEGKAFDTLEAFNTGYNTFKANCAPEDLNDYYDFRGDSNIKPNSPESNGMIWHAISVALQCQDTTHVRPTPKTFPGGIQQKLLLQDKDCADYFAHPFLSRWSAARAGLGAWILHDNQQNGVFSNTAEQVNIIPEWAHGPRLRPFDYLVAGQNGLFVAGWQDQWAAQAMGFETLVPADNAGVDAKELAYTRLSNAVDRHTDWYASGYDDKMSQKRDRTQAYSPFVASSYELSRSDAFVSPGYTVPSNNPEADAHKHFMYVFRVHKDNWFNTDSLNEGKPINFNSMWFDETSIGTTGLAKSERAWDRLGTALEEEMDSILYLHNICNTGEIESTDRPCFTPH